jgi:hypothetical protein
MCIDGRDLIFPHKFVLSRDKFRVGRTGKSGAFD